jgi:hypothetical protein
MNISILASRHYPYSGFLANVQPKPDRPVAYLCLNEGFQDVCSRLEQKGYIRFQGPPLVDDDRESVLIDYLDAIGRLSKENKGNEAWWATMIASKSRFYSPLPGLLNDFVLSLRAIERCLKEDTDLCILGTSWPVILAIKNHAQMKSFNIQVHAYPGSRLWNQIYGTARVWGSLIVGIVRAVVNVMKAHAAFGKNSDRIRKDQPVYLIKSFVYENAFQNNSSYRDPFFGDLASFLQGRLGDTMQIVTLSQGFNDRSQCYQKMKNVTDQIVVPFENYLRLSDILSASMKIFRNLLTRSIKVPSRLPFQKSDFTPLITELVASGGKAIPIWQYLYLYAARRFARQHKLRVCLMTYEGIVWERLFILGLRSKIPELSIIGYQHSVVPPSGAGVFLSEWESDFIPHPDRVVATGEKTANILKRYSFFSNEKILSGCALRYQYLYEYDLLARRPPSHQPFKLLIALEGVVEVTELLSYAIAQALELPNIRFTVRTHPILPLNKLLAILGMSINDLPENMFVSNARKVSEDIEQCDAVLYWGTTVAVEALMMGRPTINFDRGDVISYDPLFEFNEFKWITRHDCSLQNILAEIKCLTDVEYIHRRLLGRDYVEKYLAKIDEQSMESFLPNENH